MQNMHIPKFQCGNYKSLQAPAAILLRPGVNVITGQNNAGKTALLESLTVNFKGNPHRSKKTIPTPWAEPSPISWAEISLTGTPKEILQLLRRPLNSNWYVARPDHGSAIHAAAGGNGQRILETIFSEESLTFRLQYQSNVNGQNNWAMPVVPSFGLYPASHVAGTTYNFITMELRPDGTFSEIGGVSADQGNDFGVSIASLFRNRMYRFSAERFNVGACQHGNSPILKPDASNLPEVLMVMQANTTRFQQFNDALKSILPQIQHVSVRPSLADRNLVEILVWPTAKESTRIDLAQPLSECGTGIGQVLAVLYVVLNEAGDTIIVDEPQSFLHPGATRKLVEFLRTKSKQQIIIATHSATVINAASPETITITTQKDGETQFEQLDSRQASTLQLCLADIGAQLGDVFGADNILWVEGSTEVLCFPPLLEKLKKRPLMGTAIVGVRQVGDFESKDARRVLEIYRNLSKCGSLIPPAIGFVFDRECRSDQEQRELNKLGDGQVRFLRRRMYENYLLLPTGISAVVNQIEGFRATAVPEDEIRGFIEARKKDKRYFCRQTLPLDESKWIQEIDGASLLADLFKTLSETRVEYDKVEHAPLLTKWLLENAPGELEELASFLVEILSS